MFNLKTSGFDITAGSWCRSWQFTPQGALTTALRFGGLHFEMSGGNAASECFYQGLLRQDLYREEPFYPLLSLAGKPLVRNRLYSAGEGAHKSLTLNWLEPAQGIKLKREWRVYEDINAITVTASIQSRNAPLLDFYRSDYLNVIDTLPLNLIGWKVSAVVFYGRTDYTNELVKHEVHTIASGMDPVILQGNLLFLEPPRGDKSLFILHEAPPPDELRPECRGTFRVGPDGAQALTWGIRPEEITPRKARESYAVTTGGCLGGETEKLRVLQALMQTRYPPVANRVTTTGNPWGDGKCYEHLNEKFVMQEVEACARLGLQAYQIDDGWQAGGILRDISINNRVVSNDFWKIHPQKFPKGFKPLVKHAERLGVQLSLWFAPDGNSHYRNWREQKALLLDFHHQHGINVFKIDAIKLRTKEAEENLKSLLEGVHRQSAGKIYFNVDVTNGQRMGYFGSLRYGDIFVENRYARSGKAERANTYVPWRTLRNLWDLSHYLPASRLQFEFPNLHKEFYQTEKDILTAFEMRALRYDYLAAIPLMAAPLFWGEPSALSSASLNKIARVLSWHHQWQKVLPGASVFPIGGQPNGRNWTGFQALSAANPGIGFILVFRENAPNSKAELKLRAPESKAGLKCVSHPQAAAEITSDGVLISHIEGYNDFRFYFYET